MDEFTVVDTEEATVVSVEEVPLMEEMVDREREEEDDDIDDKDTYTEPVNPIEEAKRMQSYYQQRVNEVRRKANGSSLIGDAAPLTEEVPQHADGEMEMDLNGQREATLDSAPEPHRPSQAPPRALLERTQLRQQVRKQSGTAISMSVIDGDGETTFVRLPLTRLPFFAQWVVPEAPEDMNK
jgi:hypothetical protein